MTDAPDVLHLSQPCPQCKGERTLPHPARVAHARWLALHAAADHDEKSPVPQRREEARKMRQDADNNHRRGFHLDDDGRLVWKAKNDDDPWTEVPETIKCNVCDGTGTAIVPPNLYQLRAELLRMRETIAALRRELDEVKIAARIPPR